MCDHEFEQFSIAMIGIRWQCVRCDLIAPACFNPTFESKTLKAQAAETVDEHLDGNPWRGEPGSAAYHGEPIYNRESYFR